MCASTDHCPQTLDNPLQSRHGIPRRISPSERAQNLRNRSALASMPRNTLGVALLFVLNRTLGRPMPNAPVNPMEQEVTGSAARIDQIRRELAEEQKPPEDTDAAQEEQCAAVQELRDSVARSEAQRVFESQMRARELRDSMKD